jgi:2-hydroxychromene-2-carboxylate isomerase
MDLHFYYDIVCPYAYIASTQVEAIAEAAGATIHWHPVLLGGLYRSLASSQNPGADMPASKARLNLLDMHRQAERAGIELELNTQHPQRSVEAMRLLVAADPKVRPALTHALYRHYHVEQGSLTREGLAPIAAAHGVDLSVIDLPETKQALFDTTSEASGRGAFGVPSFVVGDTLTWGADRLPQVAEALGVSMAVPAVGPRRGGRLEFFHDFSSPFSYLAAMRIEAFAEAAGAELVWRPMLLGAVFRTIGSPMVPLVTMSPPRQAWIQRDLLGWTSKLGEPFIWPSAFPLNMVKALRVSILEPAAIVPMYKAAWQADKNLGDPEVLKTVLDEAGFDGAALILATQDPAIKQLLKDSTAAAVEAGVCGAPCFLVDGTWLFWGQDRLDMVDAALRGWRPVAG